MRMLVAALTALLLAASAPALAKDKGKDKEEATIQECGLASFDAVFARAGAIDERLTTARKMLGDAKRDLNAALGLDKETALQEALAALKTEAAGKFTVAMNGTMPKLEPKGDVPPNIGAALTAVNHMVDGIGGSIAELQGIPTEAAALVTEAQALPGRLKDEAKAAGVKPTELPAMLKIVKTDVEITAGLPDKATALVDRMNAVITTVTSLAE